MKMTVSLSEVSTSTMGLKVGQSVTFRGPAGPQTGVIEAERAQDANGKWGYVIKSAKMRYFVFTQFVKPL